MRKIKEKLGRCLGIFLFIIALSFLLFPEISSAEEPGDVIWSHEMAGFVMSDIVIDASGIYTLGYTSCGIDCESFWMLTKYNYDGRIIWWKSINPFPQHNKGIEGEVASAIAINSTEVYVVGGDGGVEQGQRHGYIEKRSLSNGDLIWSQKSNNFHIANDIALDSSSNAFYVTGYYYNNNNVWIMEKRNLTTGSLDRTFGIEGVVIGYADHFLDKIKSIAVRSDSFYVAGTTDSSSFRADSKWRVERRDLTTGALRWSVIDNSPFVFSYYDNLYDLFVRPDGLYAVNGFNAEKWSLSTGELVWRQRLNDYELYNIDFDIDSNLYAVGFRSGIFIAKLSPYDGSLVWGKNTPIIPRRGQIEKATGVVVDPSGQFVYIVGRVEGSEYPYAFVAKIGVRDFILNTPIPFRNTVNPNWTRDYSVNIARVNGFNDAVTLSSSVAIGAADLNITWPDGNIIAAGASGPKVMRIQAKDPPTESRRGTNYDITITAAGGGITKNLEVDFYVNQRPNAKAKAIGNTNINVGGFVKIRDGNNDGNSFDPDTLAPGNALTAVIADFNNDATFDFNGNLIGIDKCFIVGDSGNICNALWPGSASPNPASNDWQFRYRTPGAYSIRYFVFDDLIADAQAVNWTERFKSAGMATPIPVIVGPAPGQAPTAVIEIQNDSGMPIDQALPNQLFYANVSKSSDSDGTIKQVSFCVDTTPEQGSVKICDGSVMTWTFPPFEWNISDFQRNWLAIAKELRGQISRPGIYAVYAVVSDNDRMLSPVAMDKITIINPSPPTADDQSVATNEDTPVGITLTGNGGDGVTSLTNTNGNIHSLAVKADGTVWGWGSNSYNQAGDCFGAECRIPNKINGQVGFSSITKVAAGYTSSIALKSDGTVWVWGRDGNFSGNPVAQQIAGLSNVVDITAGGIDGYFYALTQEGDIYRFNYGVGSLFLLPNLPNAVDIEGGDFSNFFAIKSDGSVWRYLGFPVWTQIANLDNVVSVSGGNGFNYLFVLKSNGEVWYAPGNPDIKKQILGLTNVIQIHGVAMENGGDLKALKSDGTVWEWKKGIDIPENLQQVVGLNNVVAIGGGAIHTLALKSDGSLWGWGINDSGQLGDGTTVSPRLTPVQTQFPLTYIITSLPANGALKTSAGTVINYKSIPFTLPDNIVNYTPKLNFSSPPTDLFNFKVNDGFQDSLPATVSLTVNPVNDQPVAVFTVNPLSGQAGTTTFNVDASGSYDVEGAVSVRWDWENDGIYDTPFSIVKTASHIYATAGSKTIKLEVKDSGELTGTSTQTVDVFPPTPHNISVTNPGAAGKITSTSTQAGAVNFDCGNGGSICGPIAYNGGETITFTAIPNTGQKYSAGTWGGACAGPTSVDCALIVSADATISAVFTSPRALSVSVIGTGAGTVTSVPAGIDCGADCSEPYTSGTAVTLTAAPVNSTVAWTAGCDSIDGLTCTVAMTSDKAVTATFTPNPPLSPSDIAGVPTCANSNNADVNLSWTDNATNEAGFEIYRDTNAGFSSPAIIVVGPNTGLVLFADTTPSVSTKYYYKVRAFNDGGNSAFSSVITVTTDSCAPTFKIFDSSGDTAASINMGNTEQYTATYDADGLGGPALEITVTSSTAWTSSLPSVATINLNGLAMGVAAGTTTITGSYSSLSATASLEVRGDIQASFTALPSLFIKSPYKSTLSATILPPYIGNGLYTYAFNCGNGQVTSNTTSDTTDSYKCTYTIPPRNYTASVIITRAGANQFSDSKTIGIKPPLPTFKEKIPK